MNSYTVYCHISPSNKRYFGITSQKPERRWQNGNHYKGQVFYRAINKYEWNNIEHIIVAKGLSEDEAKWLEIELIAAYDTTNPNKGYNISLGGEGSCGYHHTEEWKKQHSETMTGKNNPNWGKCGKNHPMFGKHLTEEHRRKISENNGRAMLGKHHTEEAKRRMSEANSGENHPMFGKLGKDCHSTKIILCLTTGKCFWGRKEAGKCYGIKSTGNISSCCNGNPNHKHCGKLPDGTKLRWTYVKGNILLNFNHNKRLRRLD